MLKNYVAVTDNYIIGALWKSRKTVPFVYDRRTNTSYLCAEQEEYASPALIGYSDTLSIAYYEPTMDISMLPNTLFRKEQIFMQKMKAESLYSIPSLLKKQSDSFRKNQDSHLYKQKNSSI